MEKENKSMIYLATILLGLIALFSFIKLYPQFIVELANSVSKTSSSNIPSSYNLNTVTGIKLTQESQNSTNLCWAYAATRALESHIAKVEGKKVVYNPVHVSYASYYSYMSSELNSGGNFYDMIQYWMSGYGSVLKSKTSSYTNSKIISDAKKGASSFTKAQVQDLNLVDVTVTDTYAIDGRDFDSNKEFWNAIKLAIMKYGAVTVGACKPKGTTYKYKNNVYCASEDITHEMLIIGWDNNYSLNNFKSGYRPKNNGAWIIQNSYYVSGDDSMIYYYSYDNWFFDIENTYPADTVGPFDSGRKVWGVSGITREKYDNTYVNGAGTKIYVTQEKDHSNIVESLPYDRIAIRYTRKNKEIVEKLKSVSFNLAEGGSYTIYVNRYDSKYGSTTSISPKFDIVETGVVEYEGYHTHVFSSDISLIGDSFSIIIVPSSQIIAETFNGEISVPVNGSWIEYKVDTFNKAYTNNTNVKVSDLGSSETIPSKILVSKISLNRTTVNLIIGESTTLKATVTPTNSDKQDIAWASSNQNIVTVKNGIITGIASGTATITATATDGSGVVARCTVAVTAPTNPVSPNEDKSILITGISLNKSSLSMKEGDSASLIVTVLPTNATDKDVYWSSSNSNIVSVKDGKVTAVSSGTATITAAAKDGSNKKAACTVIVADSGISTPPTSSIDESNTNIKITSLFLSQTSLEMEIGDMITVSANIVPTNATNKNIYWSSSNKNVATVNDGKIVAISNGTVTITAAAKDGSNKKATCTVTVKEKEALPVEPPVEQTPNIEEVIRSSDNTIKKVTINDKNISLSTDNESYVLMVDEKVDSCDIRIELSDSSASFEKGSYSIQKDLKIGSNEEEIYVKAENGDIKKYIIKIIRDASDASVYLDSMSISCGNLNFTKDKTEYNIIVNNDVKEIEIKAEPEDDTALVKISGNDNLQEGYNEVNVTVETINEEQLKYVINVQRSENNDVTYSNNLKGLSIDNYNIDFSKDKTEYEIEYNGEEKLDIIVLTEDENATVEIINNDDLSDGSEIKIRVTSFDGIKKDYILKLVSKASSGSFVKVLLICIALGLITAALYFWRKHKLANV